MFKTLNKFKSNISEKIKKIRERLSKKNNSKNENDNKSIKSINN